MKDLPKRKIKNILVVDDERIIQDLLKEGLEKFEYKVAVASNGNEAYELSKKTLLT